MIIGVEFVLSARYTLRTNKKQFFFMFIIEARCVYREVWIKAEERIEH